MRQRINLYQDCFKPKPDAWSMDRVGKGLLGLALILVLYTVWLGFEWRQQQQKTSAAQAQLQQQQQALNDLQAQLQDQNQQVLLDQQLQRAEQQVRFLQQLQQHLTAQQTSSRRSFSDYLEGLARQSQKGTWLTRIELEQGGEVLRLEGRALRPEGVPQMLVQMKTEPVFAGKAFAELAMTRPESSPVLVFAIRTDAQGTPDGR